MSLPTTDAALAAAFHRAGLDPEPAIRLELLGVLARLEAMRAQLRTPPLPTVAEPAIVFAPEGRA